MNKFKKLGLSKNLLDAIEKLGFEEPTQIQEESIPHIIEGRDVLGESATGSGKTFAFGCGIVEKVVPKEGLQALVLTPTRELAEQVKNALQVFTSDKKLKMITVYGGVSINPQIDALPTSEVVVATPGRLLDHMERGTIDLSKVQIVVLDEADRMFDMGFIEDVEKIFSQCPKKRQTLLFSATISSRVRDLANHNLYKPVEVRAVKHVDPSLLKQIYYDVEKNLKLPLLVNLLKKEASDLVMVFCNTRNNVDFVEKNLRSNGIKATAIHGGLSQNKRTNTINSFNDGKTHVLVCTDVAARGLHIDNVSHVYNYEIPNASEDYVHRIGRTARAGEEGMVINLLCHFDHDNFSRVLNDYRELDIPRIDVPELERIQIVKVSNDRRRGGFRGGSRGGNRSGGHRRR
ncbi:DEAD/DEAH box helicase [Candidatus Woesearchaeota archaeon]|nr:DEAD/DEAH box helicase [Candidatus Woesearchaeota archaeon]